MSDWADILNLFPSLDLPLYFVDCDIVECQPLVGTSSVRYIDRRKVIGQLVMLQGVFENTRDVLDDVELIAGASTAT